MSVSGLQVRSSHENGPTQDWRQLPNADIFILLNQRMGLKWPPRYVTASTIAAWGGLLFGLETGTIGSVTTMKTFEQYISSTSSVIHGLIISSILIPAAIASFFAGSLADRLGRPRSMTIGGFIFGIGTALETGTVHIAMFFVGRIITGIGEGIFFSAVFVYICEIAPYKRRGPLTCITQFLICVGCALGYFVCYGTVQMNSSASWRIPLALQSFMAFSYSIASTTLPQSPRWLRQNGRHEEAARSWAKLGIEQTEEIHASGTSTPDIVKGTQAGGPASTMTSSSKISYSRVFHKDVRSRTLMGVFLMAMQQLSGIDGVLFYAPLLFRQAGFESQTSSFLASGITALVILVANIPGFLLSDHWGRKTSAVSGGLGIAASMTIIGSLYASQSVHKDHGPGRWVVVILIYLFSAIFSVTWAISLRVYASEIQPPVTRAAATSLGQSANWVTNFIVALLTPIIFTYSSSAAYFIFGSASLLTAIICIIWMRETRGRSLEMIDSSFSNAKAMVVVEVKPIAEAENS